MKKRARSLFVQPLESRRLLAAVDIPDDLTGDASALVSVPINVNDAAAIRGAEIHLKYDTELLDLDSDAITAGTVWTGTDTQVTANVDDAAGTVTIFVSASAGLLTGSGSLVILKFTVADSAVAGDTAVLDLTNVTLNEGQIPVTPASVPGSDATDGLITIIAGSGSDKIGGFVYADTNTNNAPETVEGIPGVVITLTNVTTGETHQATTDATGRYDFEGIGPGDYRVAEAQPMAYLEGGINELSATILADQTLGDQNFRELGLLPQYVYSRLHTSLVRPVGSTAWTDTILQINIDASTNATQTANSIAGQSANNGAGQVAAAASASSGDTQDAPAGEPISSTVVAPLSTRLPLREDQVAPLASYSTQPKNEDANALDQALAATSIW